MQKIAKAGHQIGAKVGFDLAHAAGNIPLKLNEWNVDFATWCSYKYLNSGPGGVGGYFIHERHVSNENIQDLLDGGDIIKKIVLNARHLCPIPTAESWQLSNAPVISMAAHLASLEIFEEAGFENLREKYTTD